MIIDADRPQLHVEGNDDKQPIIHILIRHGVDYNNKPWPPQYPKIKVAGNIDELLKVINVAVPLAADKIVGFVADANSDASARWGSIQGRLKKVAVDAPKHLPPDGFIGSSNKYNTTVGVWVMPDNQSPGAIEHLLETLINDEDPLIEFARKTVDDAIKHGAQIVESNKLKAVLRTWLAWQETPELPYGTAIRAKFFEHNSDFANSFVDWFKRLYKIE